MAVRLLTGMTQAPRLRAAWGAHLSRLTLLVREGPARVRLERLR